MNLREHAIFSKYCRLSVDAAIVTISDFFIDEASLIVLDFTISVYGSSCNYLFSPFFHKSLCVRFVALQQLQYGFVYFLVVYSIQTCIYLKINGKKIIAFWSHFHSLPSFLFLFICISKAGRDAKKERLRKKRRE